MKCNELLQNFTSTDVETKTSEIIHAINVKTKEYLNHNNRIVLCGKTPLSMHFAKIMQARHQVIIIDETDFGFQWEGIPVVSYADSSNYSDALFIVCSRTIIDHHIKLIPQNYKAVSWHHILLLGTEYDFIKYDFTFAKLYMQIEDVIRNASDYSNLLNSGLADNISKILLAKILLFRLTFDLQLHIGVGSKYVHYFDEDVISLTNKESFIDAGGYIGDTLEQFLKIAMGNFLNYYLFEPEIDLLEQAKSVSSDTRIQYFDNGLYNKMETLRFKKGNEGSGMISSQGEMLINLVKLDDVISSDVTIIKMDIEGSELAALEGAQNLIDEYMPKLAICIYHKYMDILQIYQFISARCNGRYKIYIRAEKDNLDQQIVMYAV